MLTISDIWAKKWAHYEFNKNVLELVINIFGKEKVNYFGDKEQINYLKKNIKFNNINFIYLNIVENNKLKIILNYILNLIKVRKKGENKIIILNALPIIILFSKLVLNGDKDIYFFVHGMDKVNSKNKGTYKYLNIFFKFRNRKLKHRYIVLGENIKKNLINLFPYMKEQIFYIDHPYTFNEISINKKNEELKLGTVGITSNEKGLENIFEIIRKLENKIFFKHIGKVTGEVPQNLIKFFPYKDKLLEEKKFSEEIQELKYILILYPKNSYKLTASGVYFDCIKYSKPLLGLKNEYFEYMFKKYGEIGKLFNSIDEILEYLTQERKMLDLDLEIFYKNIENIKKNLNKTIEEQLKMIITPYNK